MLKKETKVLTPPGLNPDSTLDFFADSFASSPISNGKTYIL